MIVAAFFGMATKYAEGLLAVKYRQVDKDGHIVGGPFYYIERGLGKKFKWLAILFAVFGLLAGLLGIGTITQCNGITDVVQSFVDPAKEHMVTLFGTEYNVAALIAGAVVTVFAALVIIGGIKRITKVSEFVVPFMAILYVVFAILLLICNASKIPGAVEQLLRVHLILLLLLVVWLVPLLWQCKRVLQEVFSQMNQALVQRLLHLLRQEQILL
jgi:AGCS family alanine or glycine:cation symporter